jgi:hypothetical protein
LRITYILAIPLFCVLRQSVFFNLPMAIALSKDELSELLGRPVDLNTPQDISRYFRDQVLAEAQVQYVKNR